MRNTTDIDPGSRVGSPPRKPSRLREYARLMRLDRPIGIWLLHLSLTPLLTKLALRFSGSST